MKSSVHGFSNILTIIFVVLLALGAGTYLYLDSESIQEEFLGGPPKIACEKITAEKQNSKISFYCSGASVSGRSVDDTIVLFLEESEVLEYEISEEQNSFALIVAPKDDLHYFYTYSPNGQRLSKILVNILDRGYDSYPSPDNIRRNADLPPFRGEYHIDSVTSDYAVIRHELMASVTGFGIFDLNTNEFSSYDAPNYPDFYMGYDYDLNPNTTKLAFSDYRVFGGGPDAMMMASDYTLWVYDMSTKEKTVVTSVKDFGKDTGNGKLFNPKRTSDNTLEYTNPQTNKQETINF